MSGLLVRECGPMTSLQDRGRYGYQNVGVSPSGAMDGRALALANALVGNALDVAAIEFMNLGGAFAAIGGDARIAVAGASSLAVDGVPVPPNTAVLLRDGQVAGVSHTRGGAFAYLAVADGFDLPPQLGSRSLHPRSKLGGLNGAPLRAGDRLPLRGDPGGEPLHYPGEIPSESGPIRVMLGPQDDYFTPEGLRTFLEEEFTISPLADRMGYQLAGPAIEHARGFNIVSDGIVTGHVQVPGSGQPIVLMRDRQTTGGYPKIATVISADLDRFAGMQPGAVLRFRAVGRDEALAAARALADWRDSLPSALVPVRFEPTTERLMGLNLIDGMVDARAAHL
ncbi:5-oxoprolinase subunit C family protein [Microvirga pudoricolor]|uniref:5-oxoprolinase subunit C family protein n=1 Tax=Microvirga pudoricolor TaxID=2778729 RepID=UPI0019519F85|nr:biotin-dependent carboxyltransferase family protein [Microvirga pudoricolor]MBM6592453.1 biotin-dependent carboxyltransferase family protein [Microvirga pudoricolor]